MPKPSRIKGISNRVNANGMIQKDQLFMRGKAMSGAPIINGIIQFAKSPYSARMTIAIAPPMKNINSENNKYNVPISLWLVE